MQPLRAEVVVLGGGAAGLLAGIRAAERGAQTLILEKNARPGVKILASGGGRCNLTTTREQGALLGSFREPQARFLRFAFKALPPRRLRSLFEGWGVPLVEEALEKVFPASGRARDVLDALLRGVETSGASLHLNSPVVSVAARDEGGFVVLTPDLRIEAASVILATGGCTVPRSGTTGDGYTIARGLGHRVTEIDPALVGIETLGGETAQLSGIGLEEVEAQLWSKEAILERSRRPLLFTHRGLSGPAAMDLSGTLARRGGGEIRLDLLPGEAFEELDRRLRDGAASNPMAQIPSILPDVLPRRLKALCCARAEIGPEHRAGGLSRGRRRVLVQQLKGLSFRARRPRDFERAEVTRGGVSLDEVNPKSFESKLRPGFFLVGEVLDVDGPIGGFNFQAAFATAWVGAEAAARRVGH